MNVTTRQTAATECQLVAAVRRVETPLITELVAAMFHLERLAETAGTPEQEAAAYTHDVTAEQHRSFVLGNADRIRRALETITAPYQAPAAAAPEGGPAS